MSSGVCPVLPAWGGGDGPASLRVPAWTAQTMRAMTVPQNRSIISPPQSIHQPMPSPVCHIADRSFLQGRNEPANQPEDAEAGLHRVDGYSRSRHVGNGVPVDVG